MMLLGAIALVAIGPKQLPEVARTLGKFINEMKRATGDFTKTFSDVHETTRSTFNDTRKTMNDVFSGVSAPYTPPVHSEEQILASDSTAASIDGYETNPQGSLFVPTDLSHLPSEHSQSSEPVQEEQLEFTLTSFDLSESDSNHRGSGNKS